MGECRADRSEEQVLGDGRQRRPARDQFFDLFGEASRTYDIYYHVRDFDWEEWRSRRQSNEIMMGKFVRGRVKYVRKEDAPIFVGAFRDVSLTEFDRKVLDIIRRKDGIELKELSRILGNPEAVKSSIHRGRGLAVQEHIHIVGHRAYAEGKGEKGIDKEVHQGIWACSSSGNEGIYRILRARDKEISEGTS